MSSPAATAPAALPAESVAPAASKALTVGLVGIALTAVGLLVPGVKTSAVALSWLVGVTFWSAIAIGMLMLILIRHLCLPT